MGISGNIKIQKFKKTQKTPECGFTGVFCPLPYTLSKGKRNGKNLSVKPLAGGRFCDQGGKPTRGLAPRFVIVSAGTIRTIKGAQVFFPGDEKIFIHERVRAHP